MRLREAEASPTPSAALEDSLKIELEREEDASSCPSL